MLNQIKVIIEIVRENYLTIQNVLIVSDPAHPENEGQVKLLKFGKKIFDKITEVRNLSLMMKHL